MPTTPQAHQLPAAESESAAPTPASRRRRRSGRSSGFDTEFAGRIFHALLNRGRECEGRVVVAQHDAQRRRRVDALLDVSSRLEAAVTQTLCLPV